MPDDSPIAEFLQEILDSGRDPEDVCSSRPDLLDEVRRRLKKFRAVAAQIDEIFPSSTTGAVDGRNAKFKRPDDEMPPIPGYEMQAILGHGGVGVVYRAKHIKLNRTVAVKMLLSGVYASWIERTRFLREAEAVARLSHPNVVQVYDMGEWEGRPYFTMELVEGQALAHVLSRSPWPVDKAVSLMITLARAVEAAHGAKIVHRDLKPGNILLAADGTPKISDFGLARRVDEDTNFTISGTKVGTPQYMAPEQALGRIDEIGPATDIYSLGAILYELLTGRPPFCGESTAETQRQLVFLDPVPPSRLNPRVPADLDTICLTCLHKQPGGRYPSAAALAEDLTHFSRDEAISARRPGAIERWARRIRRHPTATVATIAAVLLVTMLVLASVRSAMQRAALARAVDGDLEAVAMLQEEARWTDARAALRRAESIMGDGASYELRQRYDVVAGNLNLAIMLDAIRLSRCTSGNLKVGGPAICPGICAGRAGRLRRSAQRRGRPRGSIAGAHGTGGGAGRLGVLRGRSHSTVLGSGGGGHGRSGPVWMEQAHSRSDHLGQSPGAAASGQLGPDA